MKFGKTMVALRELVDRGSGLYTLGEAALYARMHPATVARWLKGDSAGERVFSPEDADAKFVTFVEFVQILAVRNLRVHYRLSLKAIRDAVERAKTNYGINYPFARPHTTYFFDHRLWISVNNAEVISGKVPGPGDVEQLSGKEHGQRTFKPVIEHFLKDVAFDNSGQAINFRAFHREGSEITMDPKVRFGEPLLSGCGYTPGALFESAKTEGSAEAAAKIYGVSKEEVEFCIEYFDYLQAA